MMTAIHSIKAEFLQIIKTKKLLIAIIGILFIPLIYSGAYLWAFWDPYGHMDKLPVAVVNNDNGAVYNGKKISIGDDLVSKLKDEKKFDWHFVDHEQAERGLQNQTYYMKLEIPKDFSKNAATLQSLQPKNLEILYTPNEGANYLTSKIGDSAVEKIKEEVAGAVTKTYAETMFNTIKDVSTGLNDASEGAGKLHNGLTSAQNGAGTIDKGIRSAKEGADSLQEGIGTALKGSEKMNSGVQSVKSGAESIQQNLEKLAEKSLSFTQGIQTAFSGANQLTNGIQSFNGALDQMSNGQSQLLDGAKKVQNGTDSVNNATNGLASSVTKWKDGAEQTKAGSVKVSNGISQAAAQVEAMSQHTTDAAEKVKLERLKGELQKLAAGSEEVDKGLSGLTDGASRIKTGSDKISAAANQVSSGQNSLVQGLTAFGQKIEEAQTGARKLANGSTNLSEGLKTLAQGSTQFEDGTNRLSEGSKKLTHGIGELSGGSNSLVNGMTRLSGGSERLLNGIDQLNGGTGKLVHGITELSSGANKLQEKLHNGAQDAGDVKANDDVYDMFAKPVKVKEEHLNPVPNYGTGFAPYFLPLSLFVGSLVVSIIFPLRKPAVLPKNGLSWFAGKLAVLLAIGLFQAVLADAVLLGVLGLEVKSISLFILLSIFTSWTFLAIVQFLVTALDNPGRFLAILVLVMQLISSAGTYPIELVPSILQNAAKFLPMTYSVTGFRSIISTGDFPYMWHNTAILAIFFTVAALSTLIYFMVSFKKGHGLSEQEI